VTGWVLPIGVPLTIQIDDPSRQVPFFDRSNGIGFMRIVTWAELESGTAFRAFDIPKATAPEI
jgi:hypothetical protein